uniref:5b protein n=1 Tax=Infectious bronchitis virus TaxID=11120 RepID=A4ZCK7_9GAMC|nr:5b protein [Infectious bronchitis virus]APP92725.1 5b protein [Infectious bronchitis virus]
MSNPFASCGARKVRFRLTHSGKDHITFVNLDGTIEYCKDCAVLAFRNKLCPKHQIFNFIKSCLPENQNLTPRLPSLSYQRM